MFRALPCSSSGGLRRNCIYAASGVVTLCRWLSCAPVKKEWRSNKAKLWCTVNQLSIKLDIKQGYIMMHGQPIINQVGDQTRAYYGARSTNYQSSWRSNKVILWCTVNQSSLNLEIKQGYTIMHGQPIINDVGDQTRLYYDARSTNHQSSWRSNKVILRCTVSQSPRQSTL